MGKDQTHHCQVGLLQWNHNLVNQIGQHIGIGRLVSSGFLKCGGWEMVCLYRCWSCWHLSHPDHVFLPELIEILICKGKKVLRRKVKCGFFLSG